MSNNEKAIAAAVVRERTEMSPQEVTTTRATAESWDPYDVWLTRVKQPRDRQPRRTDTLDVSTPRPVEIRTGDDGAEGGVLLPGVS